MASDTANTSGIQTRLEQAASLPEILVTGFDAFEAIRVAARGCQDQEPGLFAAFMKTADAAVDGREAVTLAPSLPLANGTPPGDVVLADADAAQIADVLAALAGVLADRLSRAAAMADLPEDQAACQDGAHAAARIRALMARGDP